MSKKGLNIHKRKDGRWEGRVEIARRVDGSIKYRSIYGKTYSEVKAKIMSANSSPSTDIADKQSDFYSKMFSIFGLKTAD